MIRQFEIVKLFSHHNRGQFIFARHLGIDHDFEVAEGSLFDNIQVYNYQEIQPILEEINSLQKDIFVFRPISLDWFSEDRFKEGQKVLLVTAD